MLIPFFGALYISLLCMCKSLVLRNQYDLGLISIPTHTQLEGRHPWHKNRESTKVMLEYNLA